MSDLPELERDLNGIGKKVNNLEVEFKRCEARKGAQLEAYKEVSLELKGNVQEIYGLFRDLSERVQKIELGIEKLGARIGTAAWGVGILIAVVQAVTSFIIIFVGK